jgi:hypothetical protein
MRSDIIAYLKQLKLKNFAVSEELPFKPNGTELFIKNVKKIYVDVEQIEQTAFIPLLDGDIDQVVTTIRVYFTTDAKQLPADYNQVVQLIRLAKDSIQVLKGFRKDATSTSEYIDDLMLTTVEFTFQALV